MTALACLKVFVGEELRFDDPEEMAALVGKLAGAYLETTWLWPRRYGLVAPYSFVLSDPRATQLDARELQALARDLQRKLFGEEGDGAITLLMFEGDQAEVMRFAGMQAQQMAALLAGEEDATILGRVCKITPAEVSAVMPAGGSVTGEPPMEALIARPAEAAPARTGYRGVFHTARQLFIGNVAVWRDPETQVSLGVEPTRVEAGFVEHDIPTLRGALERLSTLEVGVMFLPISFSTIIQPTAHAKLLPHLQALPSNRRGQLAAAVYDVPRAPSFSALARVKAHLSPFFSRIDLRVMDPAFQVDDLPPQTASSVTLALPVASEAVRLAAIARFMRDPASYRRRGVLQGIGDVRTRRELNACLEHAVPFLTGPAITDLLEAPTGVLHCPALNLPLHDWSITVRPEEKKVSG